MYLQNPRLKIFLILLLNLSIFIHAYAQPSSIKALVGGTLIDGFGGEPISNSVIIIEGDRIKEVGTIGLVEIPETAEVISTEGMSVLPGLWDSHVHLMINGHLRDIGERMKAQCVRNNQLPPPILCGSLQDDENGQLPGGCFYELHLLPPSLQPWSFGLDLLI